jgi:hypothetical protein
MTTHGTKSHPLAGVRLTPEQIDAALRRGRGLPPVPRKTAAATEAEVWLELLLARAAFEEAGGDDD